MPEPKLRWLFSRGCASPKNREKNSSIGSLEPLRGERCAVVEMFTTTGMVFFAIVENDGGRLSRAARLAASTHRTARAMYPRIPKINPATAGPYNRANEFRFWRSEEHTSELQSLRHLVCRLVLE